MKIQVLVAAMHQTDHSLVEKMQVKSDILVGNQCDRCADETVACDGFSATYYHRPDRGVGLNRNVTLMHSGDEGVLLFADDDTVYVDGYERIITEAFEKLPQADAIIFNIETIGAHVGRRENQKIKRVRFYNALNYGTTRIAVKAQAVHRNNLSFHTCFGGGTRYGCGEDTLFIVDMLKSGMKLYTYPACIAKQYQYESTWFNGYNEKYLHDKGALFAAISKPFAKLLCLQDLVRHKTIYRSCGMSFQEAYRVMKDGVAAFRELRAYTPHE